LYIAAVTAAMFWYDLFGMQCSQLVSCGSAFNETQQVLRLA
jgi:hypothetical protein